jgi:hypothetical protein
MNIGLSKLTNRSSPKIIGSFLAVNLPLIGVKAMQAKVDTGAYSGSMHATEIKEIVGKKSSVLQFVPHGATKAVRIHDYHRRQIKSSSGHVSNRYAIDTELEIMGENYGITITLSDRSSMKNPMLIGRKFLLSHGFLVDVSINNK